MYVYILNVMYIYYIYILTEYWYIIYIYRAYSSHCNIRYYVQCTVYMDTGKLYSTKLSIDIYTC